MSLGVVFTGSLPAEIARDLSVERLEARLADLVARAASAHPDIAVDGEGFAAYLASVAGPQWSSVSRLVDEVAADDLYLAYACGRGDASAIADARRRYDGALAGYVARLRLTGAELDDLRQSLWERLLVGAVDEPPRILKYSGAGPLDGWIGIVAQRLALSMRRHQGAEERRDEALGREALTVASGPELRLLRGRYREEFDRAVHAALAGLPDRDRAILRLQTVAGLSLEKIAPLYGVNPSTISRWAAQARAAVVESTRQHLAVRLPLTPDEFASLAGALLSVLDVTLGQLMDRV